MSLCTKVSQAGGTAGTVQSLGSQEAVSTLVPAGMDTGMGHQTRKESGASPVIR